MTIALDPKPLPLAADDYGIIRVSGTRVTLDTLVHSFLQGETAEQIAQNYDAVPLADIYEVIGFYLNQKSEVDAYLLEGKEFSKKIRFENEAKFPAAGIRQRLLARNVVDSQPPVAEQ